MQKEESEDNAKKLRPFLRDAEHTDCVTKGDISKKISIFRHNINPPKFRMNQLWWINENSMYLLTHFIDKYTGYSTGHGI